MERPADFKSWFLLEPAPLRERAGEVCFRLNWLLALVLAFSLCMPDIWVRNFFFFWSVTWFFEAMLNGRLLHPRLSRRHIVLYLMVLFYLLMLVSLLYTDNLHYSKRMLERRLAFAVLPVAAVFGLHPAYRLKPLLTAFVAGALCHLMLMLAWPVLHYLSDFGFRNYLHQFPGNYVVCMLAYKHRAFFCIIQLMAWLTAYTDIRRKTLRGKSGKHRMLSFGLYSLLLLSWCVLSQGRLNMLLGSLLLLWMLFDQSRRLSRQYRQVLGILLLCLGVSGAALLWQHPAFEPLRPDSISRPTDPQLQEGRIGIWQSALDLLGEDGLWLGGAGVGDAKDLLMEKYRQRHLAHDIISNRSHAHNTFLHTALESGILSVAVWTAILLLPLFLCSRRRRPLLTVAALCWLLLMTTETVTMQAGGFIAYSLMQFVWALTDYGRGTGQEVGTVGSCLENRTGRLALAGIFSVSALSVLLTVLFLTAGPRGHDPCRPQTYAVGPYTLISDLPGDVPPQLEHCLGYRISKISKGEYIPANDAVDFTTGFRLRDRSKGRFTAWCYVSRDFNGFDVMLRTASNADRYRFTAPYDLSRRESWQKLEIPIREDYPDLPFTLFFRLAHVPDLSTMTGYVIFALPQFED